MDTQPSRQAVNTQQIQFPNGNRALAVTTSPGTRAIDLVHALGISQPKALILIAGGTPKISEHNQPGLIQLFTNGIAHVAASFDAVIIDGGTQSGVMALMGQGVAQQQRKPTLLGISPAGMVTYPGKPADKSSGDEVPLEPNHTHFVLVKTDEWGGETETMYELAKVLSAGCPSLAVLVNGGPIAKNEVLLNVRQGRPVIVIEGSGRLADEIAGILHEQPPSISDPELSEITTNGDLHLFPLTGSAQELEQLTQRLLSGQ